jgi:Tol biopolymer transport system component
LLFLRDIRANRQIAVITGTLSFGVTPKWTPDGHQLLIVGPSTLLPLKAEARDTVDKEELFSLDRDGTAKRLTYLTATYSTVRIWEFSISPDGRYVSLWADARPSSDYLAYPDSDTQSHLRLFVLDLATKDVVNYCIPGFPWNPPVWSPDGHYLIVQNQDHALPPTANKSHVYLVDLDRSFAVQIADVVTPVGWMTSQP